MPLIDHGDGIREFHGTVDAPLNRKLPESEVVRIATKKAEAEGLTVWGVKVIGYHERGGWCVSIIFDIYGRSVPDEFLSESTPTRFTPKGPDVPEITSVEQLEEAEATDAVPRPLAIDDRTPAAPLPAASPVVPG